MSSWSLATATAVAHQLALENGDAPARLLRFGSNGLFVVGPHTVARISPSSRNVARGVQFALAAAEAGLPVLTPLGGQVYERDGLLVTLWPYHPKADGPVDYRWLGEVVARLHRLAPRLADACDLDLARNELPQTQLAKVGQRLETLRDHAAYGRQLTYCRCGTSASPSNGLNYHGVRLSCCMAIYTAVMYWSPTINAYLLTSTGWSWGHGPGIRSPWMYRCVALVCQVAAGASS